LNLVNNGGIDTRCNKNAIIIYCTLAPIPHECIIPCDIVLFHGKYEVQQMLFQGQFGWPTSLNVMCLHGGPSMTNDGQHSSTLANSSNSLKVKLMKVLNKPP
jgi:hypothetical protein